MANSWLRLYHDMPNDPKFKTIARVSKQPISVVLGVYVHLLVNASAAVERGTLDGYNNEDLATALDVDSPSVGAILDAMQGRVLDGDKVTGWEKRQVNREDSSTERVKQWRERKCNAVKRGVTQSNAVKHNVTADKSREEEIKKEQKPSRVASDQRHVPFKLAIQTYMTFKGATFAWDASEARALDLILKAVPTLTLAVFQACLNHRARSPGVPHGERPRVWLPHILKYQEAPLNEFGKTETGNGTFKGKSGHSVDAATRAIQAIEDRHAADRAGNSETGEAGHGGLSTLRLGP